MRLVKTLAVLSVLLVVATIAIAQGGPILLNAAGATFPFPIYSKWFDQYHQLHPSVQINYQSIGSGGGIRQLLDKTVDFGASDAAMTPEEIGRVDPALGVQLLPMTAGSIVITYNLPDVKELKLSRQAYSGIFLGKVKKWNDPAIAKVNPGVKLPDLDLTIEPSGAAERWVDRVDPVCRAYDYHFTT